MRASCSSSTTACMFAVPGAVDVEVALLTACLPDADLCSLSLAHSRLISLYNQSADLPTVIFVKMICAVEGY